MMRYVFQVLAQASCPALLIGIMSAAAPSAFGQNPSVPVNSNAATLRRVAAPPAQVRYYYYYAAPSYYYSYAPAPTRVAPRRGLFIGRRSAASGDDSDKPGNGNYPTIWDFYRD